MNQNQFITRIVKPVLFVFCLVPFLWLVWDTSSNNLGANPVEEITHRTGDWILRLLLVTLAVTPLRRISGIQSLLRIRRMVGLFTFFYACLHFLTYIWLDQFFDVPAIVEDVVERPYITIGFSSFLLLIPLAVTSTNAMVRRLGGKRWQQLHRLVYVIGIGGVVHYLWLVKSDLTQPLFYALLLILLLGYRLTWYLRESQRLVKTNQT